MVRMIFGQEILTPFLVQLLVLSGSEDSICEIELVVGKSALGQPWTQRVPPFICTTSIQQLLLSKALI